MIMESSAMCDDTTIQPRRRNLTYEKEGPCHVMSTIESSSKKSI
jgi:hypothetical protein